MIFIDRAIVNVPDILIDKSKKGFLETEKNKKFAENGEWEKLDFSAYSDGRVKDTLQKLFNGKCAYCESKFLHVYPGDIEHFRPKGEIEEASPNKKPGYYWLAAEWDNLLLSCRNCNQKLKHLVFGANTKVTMGKMNQFPLFNNTKHTQSHDDLISFEEEEANRLLINPCKEYPEHYLEYGLHGVIKPKDLKGRELEMAQKSIEVYVLQRMPLVQAREKVLIEINAQMQRVLEAVNNLSEHISKSESQDKRVIYDKILKRELIRLKKFMNDDEEYAGMARQVINEFIATLH